MSHNDPIFSLSSENEKRFRMCICALGLMFALYTAAAFLSEVLSLDGVRDFIIRTSFMVDDLPSEISGFTK